MAIPSGVCKFWHSISKYIFRFGVVGLPLSALLFILYIIFNDEFLSQHIIASGLLSTVYFFTCCLLILSRICVLRRKRYAKNTLVELLCDTDLKFVNETEEVIYYKLSWNLKDFDHSLKNFLFKNPYVFSKFRPAYGMALITGFAFIIPFIVAIQQIKEFNYQDDMYCVAVHIAFPATFLIGGVYVVANLGIYFARREVDFYAPFQEHIQIPFKVLLGKAVAAFITAGNTHAAVVLFLISLIALCIISSNYIYRAADIESALQSFIPIDSPDARRFAIVFLMTSCVGCINVLVTLVLVSFVSAKESILGIIETNWKRNFVAIEYLLPNNEMKTLQELKDALKSKRVQHLTQQEQDAFRYIDFPIWKTKQPFRGRWVFTTDVPGSSSKQLQRQPEEIVQRQQTDPWQDPPILKRKLGTGQTISSESEDKLIEKAIEDPMAVFHQKQRVAREAASCTSPAATKRKSRKYEPEASTRVLRPRKQS